MKEYLKEIPKNIRRIKIDIGLSYGAPHSENWLEQNDDLFVFGFEPNPESVSIIQNGNIQKQDITHGNVLQNHNMNRFCLIPVALGNVKEHTNMDFFQMSKDCGTSSLHYPIDASLGEIKNIIKVPVYNLKDFFDVFDWNRFPFIEYIKIDAQGSDYDILLGAGSHYLQDHVVYITAEPECNQYVNVSHNTHENIKSYLESLGFNEVHHPNTKDPTFINSRFLHLKDSIYICQYG